MKRILSIVVAFVATITVGAQNIAVVSPSNTTTIYQTLDEAITNAEKGSIIYIPGGGFTVTDNAKIDKKLTIMGVSHRGDTDNVDGATIISGNLNFIKGSSHSAVIGVYVSGNINVATKEDSVANFTMRHCNVNSVLVKNSHSSGMVINQCYLRGSSDFGGCNVSLENNIIHCIREINGGKVNYNIITSNAWAYYTNTYYAMYNINSSSISYNYFLNPGNNFYKGSDNYIYHNCRGTALWKDDNDSVQLPEGTKWEDVFNGYVSDKALSIASDYHLSKTWAAKNDPSLKGLGIYGFSGTDFSDKALAPIPRIVSKRVAESTDGSGKLQIEVTVKAQ